MKPFFKPLLTLSAVVIFASQTAQAVTIYSDSFSRGTVGTPLALNGSSPDVGTGTWVTRTNGSATDGSSLILSNSSTASLAFVPAANQIYTLTTTLSFSGSSTTSSQFAGIGFFNSTSTTAANVELPYSAYANSVGDKTPWMFFRGGNSDSNLIGDLNARPLGSTTPIAVDVNLPVTNLITMTLILNTSGTQWTLEAYYGPTGSTPIDLDTTAPGNSLTYTVAQTNALASGITRVGISNLSNTSTPPVTVTVENFSLTSVPEPSTAIVFTGAIAAMTLRRRRA